MTAKAPGIVLVTRSTRLADLKARWGTVGQARFRLQMAHEHELALRQPAAGKSATKTGKRQTSTGDEPQRSGGARVSSALAEHAQPFADAEFAEYEAEDAAARQTLDALEEELDFGVSITRLDRELVPNYDFWNTAVVVVVGQDGLVANTAKYVGDVPIVAVNPDPVRIDGVLLPYRAGQVRRAVGRVLEGRHHARLITLAEAQLNDGQRMLAFNDLFVGSATHVSARYTLQEGSACEPQSSSGVLVSTGAGSTGWMSSVFTMAQGVAHLTGGSAGRRLRLDWEDRRLLWAVREPFVSKHSRASLVAGYLCEGRQLVIESLMPAGGVIFSDGIEQDFLPFTSGAIVRIGVSRQAARLVVD